jgi:hypothetical protein
MAQISDNVLELIRQREEEKKNPPLSKSRLFALNLEISSLEKLLHDFPHSSKNSRDKVLDKIIEIRDHIQNGCVTADDYSGDNWKYYCRPSPGTIPDSAYVERCKYFAQRYVEQKAKHYL